MSSSDFAIVILAAGKGTRLKSAQAKVLHRAGGRSLVEHVALACRSLGARAIYAVVGHQAEQVAAVVEPLGVASILQQPQNGTGHAMLLARRAIGTRVKYALVVPGDAPLVRTETLRSLLRTHREGKAAATILTAEFADPTGYGRILRKSGNVVAAIVEQSALSDDQRAINEVNSSIYCFTLAKLWPCLAQVRPNNAHREIYLTDAIALLAQKGETVLAQLAADADEILGCNTCASLADVDRVFRARKRAELMGVGVTIQLPETVLVDPDVTAGADTTIEPFVQLLGKTRIGANCLIRAGSIISDSVLEDGVTVKPYSVIHASRLGKNSAVGPFAHLREGAQLQAGARVGNFVEMKKSVLGEGAKAMHLTYLGDSRIGRNTNIGAGTITCNYDGTKKNPTTIGDRVFIGSNTALVAPVKVGDGAYVAAGSTITENVPSGALGIARGKQANKPGWVAARKREAAAAEEPKRSSKKRPRRKPRRATKRRPTRKRKPARRR